MYSLRCAVLDRHHCRSYVLREGEPPARLVAPASRNPDLSLQRNPKYVAATCYCISYFHNYSGSLLPLVNHHATPILNLSFANGVNVLDNNNYYLSDTNMVCKVEAYLPLSQEGFVNLKFYFKNLDSRCV
ncbi:hypothetical protein L1987_23458 [Smallanthus sonchifolius]|uniref:Uncharacterized protein n=1 Tax=Smallanthus sonchifolius TaxID=185202 RepID=A0ACB9IJ16_9ASTR|nr:hypothetical protein L1987_23458 [Smallanthus sonchifolius]